MACSSCVCPRTFTLWAMAQARYSTAIEAWCDCADASTWVPTQPVLHQSLAIAEELSGPWMARYCKLAAEFKLWLSLGGFQEKVGLW